MIFFVRPLQFFHAMATYMPGLCNRYIQHLKTHSIHAGSTPIESLSDPTTSEIFEPPPHPSALARFSTYFGKLFNDMGLFACVYILVKPFSIFKDSVEDILSCCIW